MTNIGIIGTAGRAGDGALLTWDKFAAMKFNISNIIAKYYPNKITLISGGAAYADHIAVQLFIQNPDLKLRLHLPVEFDQKKGQFKDTGVFDFRANPGGTANYYHRKFCKKCDVNSFSDICGAIDLGAEVIVTPGFIKRNTEIAKDSQIMIALTFGYGAMLKDGGTADTMKKFLAKKIGTSYHVDCNTMQIHMPAIC